MSKKDEEIEKRYRKLIKDLDRPYYLGVILILSIMVVLFVILDK